MKGLVRVRIVGLGAGMDTDCETEVIVAMGFVGVATGRTEPIIVRVARLFTAEDVAVFRVLFQLTTSSTGIGPKYFWAFELIDAKYGSRSIVVPHIQSPYWLRTASAVIIRTVL